MQQPIAACTRAQSLTRPCPCATCNWLLHPAPTSAQGGHDPPQLALVVFFLPSISANTSLALAEQPPANCTDGVFLYQLAHLLTSAHDLPCCHYPPPIALAVAFPLPTRQLLMCTHAHEHVLQLHCVVCIYTVQVAKYHSNVMYII